MSIDRDPLKSRPRSEGRNDADEYLSSLVPPLQTAPETGRMSTAIDISPLRGETEGSLRA